MRQVSSAVPAVLELDGFAWREAGPVDAGTLDALAARGSNRVLFNLPASSDEFLARVGRPGFRIAMLCTHDSKPIGAAATTERNNRSLNVQLLCFFIEPSEAALPLAAYVRHLFWSLPLHRVYVQMPLVPGADAYGQLLQACGFQDEGRVSEYAMIAGKPTDVAVLGLLRREFEAWCQEHEKRLAL
jgi:hypothetical protein